MDYGLIRPVSGSTWHFESLSRTEFDEAISAQRRAGEVLELEEKLSLLLDNYQEYERELLQMALRTAVELPDLLLMASERLTANRRLLNLLSSCYLYLQQIRKSVIALVGRKSPVLRLCDQWETQERLRLGFRAMEEIRHHVQHFGLPLYTLSYRGEWIESRKGSRQRKLTVRPKLDLQELERDKGFDRKILAELRGLGEQLDLKVLARAYVAGIGNIHAQLRDAIKSEVSGWDSRVLALIEQYGRASGDTAVIGLEAVARDEQGGVVQAVEIFDFPLTRRKWLENKTRGARSLESVLITSE